MQGRERNAWIVMKKGRAKGGKNIENKPRAQQQLWCPGLSREQRASGALYLWLYDGTKTCEIKQV